MNNIEEKSFSEVMDLIKTDEGISVPLLYRLSDLIPSDLDHFCVAWKDLDLDRKRKIVRHLADIAEENFEVDFTLVFRHCLSDKLAEVRLASLAGLWDSEQVDLISSIIKMMEEDPDIEVRTLAAATLGHYILLAEWQQIPLERADPIVQALLRQIDHEDTAWKVRLAALESLGASSHKRVASEVEQAYDSADAEMQVSAVYAMGRSADNRWFPIVKDEMSSEDTEMRIEAARAAGGIGKSEAVPELGELIWDDDLEVRLAAVGALGEIGGESASHVLVQLTEDPEASDLHEAAEEALEQASWMGEDIDMSLFNWENDLENED